VVYVAGVTARRQRWALGIVCLSVLVITIDNLIVNVALPTLVRELHASTSELQWIVDAYILVFAGLLLVGGSLGDRFGRALVLRIGLVVFGVASASAAFSTDATALVISRGVMGVGAALIMPTSVAVVTNVFTEPRARGRALGVWSAVGGLGVALGPIVGGVLLSQFWWGSVFLVNVPIVVIAVAGGWWAIPESRNPDASRFDPLGVVLSVVSVSAIVWATIQAPSQGWLSAATLGSFAVAFALLGGFVIWELRCAHPMLELGFFRNPRFSVSTLTSGVGGFAFAGTLFALTQFLQFVLGYSPLAAGVRLAPLAVALMVAAPLGSRLAERVGTKRAVAFGLFVFAAGLVVLATVSEQRSSYLEVLVGTVAIGAGFGAMSPPNTDAVMGSVPRAKAGVASGTLSTTRQVSNAIGVAVIGSILVSGYHSELASRTGTLDLSRADRAAARASGGDALGVAEHLGRRAAGDLSEAARSAYIHGMRLGLLTCAVAVALGAILALRHLPARAGDDLPAGDALRTDEAQRLHALDVVLD
jgi:EmrB/QacA subfamily drug resistance transporter